MSTDRFRHIFTTTTTGVSAGRRWAGAGAAVAMLAVLTLLLTAVRSHVTLAGDVSLYLLVVVLASLIGGLRTALVTAVAAVLLLNYFFTAPLHTLDVANAQSVVDLVVFLIVATIVCRVVDVASHQYVQMTQMEQEAVSLSMFDQQRTALLNAVGHDLRAPLARAKVSVSSLRATDVQWSDADRAELLQSADNSLDLLTDLVTNLLDLSRLQAGAVAVIARPVGLDDVVAAALAHIDPDRHLDIDIPDDLPLVQADPALLERVVANLVQNALRYSPGDGRVRLQARQGGGDEVELRVIDHGPGIPDSARQRLFAPFQRLDDSPVDGAGVGLGLAIARGFTEAMGGRVELADTPGGGATLVVTLRAGAESGSP